jgi:enoyl-[acyl-carrier protein] reductase I
MLNIDLTGKRALVAGVADDAGFGFAIAKSLAEAGASVSVATWPPALNIFTNLLERGKMDESRMLSGGQLLEFEKVYPLDAAYDTLADAPEDIRASKRYKETGDFSIDGLRQRIESDFGKDAMDIVIHSLANGPEVKKPLLDTSRSGYLTAISVSAYSLISMVSRLAPLMRKGERARDSRLRRRYVVGEGGARERHPCAGVRGRPQVRAPRQLHLGRSIGVARGERHRNHREDGRILRH